MHIDCADYMGTAVLCFSHICQLGLSPLGTSSGIPETSHGMWVERLLFLLLLLASLMLSSVCLLHSQKNNHKNISELLDSLLRGYDNSLRPDFGGPPTLVEIDIMVRSMGPISEVDMSFSMDCYFRQSWVDRRLVLTNYKDALALSISMLARIWKPDTHLYNGRQSYLHTITTPNKFVRLYPDGRVLYSSRLTIKASCPMNLEDFPMDMQRCPLKMGSFGYTTTDVIYMWNSARRVNIASDMKMSQFDLISTPSANQTDVYPTGDRSVLVVSFHLRRHTGYFLLQVYFPCVLLNVLSWVAFWINREATADRVALGVTTVLTMTFLGMEARMDLPKVPYPTALDFFVFMCFGFIFASIIQVGWMTHWHKTRGSHTITDLRSVQFQFALVHYFTKYGSGEVYFYSSDEDDPDQEDQESCDSQNVAFVMDEGKVSPPLPPPPPPPKRWPRSQPLNTRRGKYLKRVTCRNPSPTFDHSNSSGHRRFNSVSKIDRLSRFLFPLAFLVINIFYWLSYLTKDKL